MDAEPIIAVKRFDRVTSDAGRSVDGLPIPYRLHQEDVCQAKGVSRELKYEPTGVNYSGLSSMRCEGRRRIKWRTGSLSAITSCSTMP
ncbi:MAG: HipA domain-containing protein [Collinsella sp.]